MTRLKLPALIACLMLAGLSVACPSGERANHPTPPKPATGGSSAAPAVAGGILRLPLEIEVNDPLLKQLDFSDQRLFALARCLAVPLVRAGTSGELMPGLAESWELEDDGAEWRFILRTAPGHEAEPAYLGEVWIEHLRELLRSGPPALKAQVADLIGGAVGFRAGKARDIDGVTLDGSKLTIKLTRAHTQLPLWLSQPGLGVMLSNDGTKTLGPFTFSHSNGNELVLAANPQALDGPPLLYEVHFLCGLEREEQLDLFRTGQLECANLPLAALATIQDDPALAGQQLALPSTAMILGMFDLHQFPWGDGPFQSKQGLREALNWGLDREYIQEALNDQIEAWPHFLPPAFSEYIPPELLQQPRYPLGTEIERARRALKEADHEQGSHLLPGMDLGFPAYEHLDALAVEVLEFWEEISVKMRPFPMTDQELAERVDKGTHEIILRKAYPAYPSPDALFYPLLYSALNGLGGNWSLLDDDEVDALITASQATADEVSRKKLYRDLSNELEQRALLVFIGSDTPTILISNELAGLSLSPYDFDASLAGQDFAKLGFKAAQ